MSQKSTLIYESEVLQDVSRLDKAWSDPETFILLPDRLDVSVEWIEKGMNALPETMRKDHFALLTSGSTGRPKLIIGKRSRTEALARLLHELQESEPVERTVLTLPLSYSYAFVNQYVWSRVSGRELVITRGLKEADHLEEALAKAENSMLCMVGAQMPIFLRTFGNKKFEGVIRLHFAGGQFPQQWISEIQSVFPNAKVFNNYGCAEAMPRLSLRPLEVTDEGRNIGRPLTGITMKTDEDNRILFQSPYRAVAFYSDEGLQIIEDDDWIPSGDLGEEIKDGYWRILGRSNEVFKRYGEKVALPRILETVYSAWPHHAAIYLMKDPVGEEGYVLVLSPEPKKDQVMAVLRAFRANHPRPLWPLKLESIPQMPLLGNGKTDTLMLQHLDNRKVHWEQRIAKDE